MKDAPYIERVQPYRDTLDLSSRSHTIHTKFAVLVPSNPALPTWSSMLYLYVRPIHQVLTLPFWFSREHTLTSDEKSSIYFGGPQSVRTTTKETIFTFVS
jgi:hypothetical protein